MKKRSSDLTRGKIPGLLLRLSLPMLMGMASMTAFNLADTVYVGWLGKEELAALSFTFPVVMILNSISLGIGMGASALVSTLIGARDRQGVRRLATDALLLGLLAAFLAATAGELLIHPLFRLLGARGTVLEHVVSYMRIWFPGIIFVVIPMVGNNLIRATGDMKVPGILMSSAAFMNIILDPLLIFGPGPLPALGVAGAALATVISRAVSMVIALTVIVRREQMIDLRNLSRTRLLTSWAKILHIGIPAALTNIITPVSMGVITRLVSVFGTSAVAGFGVATRLEMLVMMLVMAVASVLMPFTGQNNGARRMDRVRSAVRISCGFSAGWSVLVLAVFLLFGSTIAAAFNTDPQVISTASSYMNILALSYAFMGFLVFATSVLNALKKPLLSLSLSVTRLFLLYIPLAWAGSSLFGLTGIFIGAATANLVSGIISLPVLSRATGPLFTRTPSARTSR